MSETEGGGAPVPESGARGPYDGPPPPKRQRGKSGGKSDLDPDAWMVTFSDLLTLLMTFFVLIFASQDPVPPSKLQEAFGQETGVFSQFRMGFLEQIFAVARKDVSQDRVQIFLNETGSLDIEVEQQERGLVITLPTDAFFEPGSATVNKRARARVDKLSAFLAASRHRIRVEGHTDDRERVSPAYPSVWELSVARAHRIQLRLIAKGVPERRLTLIGYGPAKPRFDNVSRLGRARNRRVEIIILNRGRGNR